MQTVYQTQTAKAKVCFVVVPEEAKYYLLFWGILNLFRDKEFVSYDFIKLPDDYLQLIGPLSEVSEEQAGEIVDNDRGLKFWYKMYCNPEGLDYDVISTTNPVEALQSLARSLGIPEGQNVVVLAEFIS